MAMKPHSFIGLSALLNLAYAPSLIYSVSVILLISGVSFSLIRAGQK